MFLVPGLSDESYLVRNAALFTLGQFAEHFQVRAYQTLGNVAYSGIFAGSTLMNVEVRQFNGNKCKFLTNFKQTRPYPILLTSHCLILSRQKSILRMLKLTTESCSIR